MNIPLRYLLLTSLFVLMGGFLVKAQLPNCGTNIIYLQSSSIYNWDPTQPFSATNPVLNTIPAPSGGFGGFAVSPNINSSTAASPTFYTVSGGVYCYWSGSAWVSTGHTPGNSAAINLGAGGGYIYSLVGASGDVYKYDGTGNATLVTTVTGFSGGGPYDLAVDCMGNFYILRIQTTGYLRKYSPNGTLLQSWTISGAPSTSAGGGFGIVNGNIYYYNSALYGGTLSGTNINFTNISSPPSSITSAGDWGNCPIGGIGSVKADIDTGYYCGYGAGVKVKALGNGPFQWTVLSGSAVINGSGDSVQIQASLPSKIRLTSLDTSICAGTSNSDTVLIVPVKPSIFVPASFSITGCGQYTDTLHASLTNTVSWITYSTAWTPAATISAGINTLNPVVNPVANTTYTMTVATNFDRGGCIWKDSVKVTTVDQSVTADYSFNIRYGCSADTVDFTDLSSAGISYKWDFGDGLGSTVKSPSHVYNTQQNYNVTLVMGNGNCADTITKAVDITHPLTANFTVDKDSICQGAAISFTNTSVTTVKNGINPTYFWNFGDGGTATTDMPSHQFDKSGVYNVMMVVTDFVPCLDTAYHTVLVDSIPFVNFTLSDSSLCQGQSIQFNGNYLALGNTGIKWNFGDSNATPNMNPVQHAYDLPGNYTVKLTAFYRLCPDTTYSRELKIKSFPIIDLGKDTSLCPGSNAIPLYDHSAHTDYPQYLWNTGSTSSSITAVDPGVYYATVTVDGCSTSDSVEIFRDCYLNIPNSFTPNGDGINTYFLPRDLLSKGATKFSMKIFNRWGQTIFETTSLNGRGWDGKLNGVDQPDGVYVYMIEVEFTNGTKEKYQGNVTLLR